MNTDITIVLENDVRRYAPGDIVRGQAHWSSSEPVESVEIRVGWYTEGKGTRDSAIVHSTGAPHPRRTDEFDFEFTLPAGPYSVSGKLVSLVWTVEAIVGPSGVTASEVITVGPAGKEILLRAID